MEDATKQVGDGETVVVSGPGSDVDTWEESFNLPAVMNAVVLIQVLGAIIATATFLNIKLYWALPYSIGAIIASPFLLGFSDIVRNLRIIAKRP